MSEKRSLHGRTAAWTGQSNGDAVRGYADQPITPVLRGIPAGLGPQLFHGVAHQLPRFGRWGSVALSLHSARELSPIVRAFQRIHTCSLLRSARPPKLRSINPPYAVPRLAVYSRLSGLDHPYFRLMHRALERGGISIAGDVEIGVSWLRSNRGSIDAVHFHWPETIWRDRRKGRRHVVARTLHAGREMLRLARFLREAHRLGIACVWTIHNLEPHEGGSLWDWLGYRLFARSADIVVSHSATALADAAREYRVPAGHSLVMPMGAMHEAYPRARPRDAVLRELGLDPALPMISCLGRIREYQGLDLACAAVQRLNGRVQLVVAGPVHAGFDVGGLREAIARVPGALLIPRQLSDQEFADLMAASDAAFLPYRNITGSAVSADGDRLRPPRDRDGPALLSRGARPRARGWCAG